MLKQHENINSSHVSSFTSPTIFILLSEKKKLRVS